VALRVDVSWTLHSGNDPGSSLEISCVASNKQSPMNRITRLVWLSLILVMSSLAFAQSVAHPFLWTASGGMEDLGTLPGWQSGDAEAINNLGQVVGYDYSNDGDMVSFGWTPVLGTRPLRGTQAGGATGVNAARQVVGDGPLDAFLWTEAGGIDDLGNLGGGTSYAAAINAAGVVVGASQTANQVLHAFVWNQGSGMQDLMNLARKTCPTCDSQALGVNNNGVIVGAVAGDDGGAYPWAFVYKNGNVVNLGDLGGSGKLRGSVAFGINESGQVVGEAWTPTGTRHPFLWTRTGGMQDLGILANANECYAFGVNDSAQVVGYCLMLDGTVRAFIWGAATGIQDLGTLPGGTQARAYAINNAGQVVGWSETQ